MTKTEQNAATLSSEFAWFSEVIQLRFSSYFGQTEEQVSIFDLPPPDLEDDPSPYADFLRALEKKRVEGEKPKLRPAIQLAHRLTVLMALAPHVQPAALDLFFTKNSLYDRGFTEFGGVTGKAHGGFLPTGETVMFVLAGGDLPLRNSLLSIFQEDHFFFQENILDLRGHQANEPFLSGVLTLSDEYLTLLTTGDPFKPRYSGKFPARQLQTKLTWEDLVLEDHLREEIEEISSWIQHEHVIMSEWEMDRQLKPGYRTLFYGPPGTGKTLCAALLGKRTGLPVYRIDLSQVVSKYIGETEKNLAHLFNRAENKNWILFFDEADALFGKRTSTRGANERYANQEVAYLLQRIEDYNGLVILATNLKGNIDEAFARRFQSMVYFPIPGPRQRLKLWENAFGKALPLADDVDLEKLARDYELAGGAMVNVVRYCAIATLRRGEQMVRMTDVIAGIRRELRKGGKTV